MRCGLLYNGPDDQTGGVCHMRHRFEQKVAEWLDAFESCGIGLVFFFDGLVDPLKRATSLERRSRDAKYATSVLHSLQERANTGSPPRVLLPILAAVCFPVPRDMSLCVVRSVFCACRIMPWCCDCLDALWYNFSFFGKGRVRRHSAEAWGRDAVLQF